MGMTPEVAAAGRKKNAANLAKRRALARKYGLMITEFMPKNIWATLEREGISWREIPSGLLPPKPARTAPASGSEIPLSAIPARRHTKHSFTEDDKRRAVAMLGSKTVREVADEMDITDTTLRNWTRALDPTAGLRLEIEAEKSRRKSRLEHAAVILEMEGARALAIQIRSFAGTLDSGRKRK